MTDFSVAMTSMTHRELEAHLIRDDGQEDLAFFIWVPASGATRETAIVSRVVLPDVGDREVHGNVSFASGYFLRACHEAVRVGGGVGLIHSHPGATRWQGLSADDFAAEAGHAAQAVALTDRPLVGLTMAGNGVVSARTWKRVASRSYEPTWATSVRVVGGHFRRFSAQSGPSGLSEARQRRTIDTWGGETQSVLADMRVGLVGVGSVGSLVLESLSRTGFGDIVVLDFDSVKAHNLDRLLHANRVDAFVSAAKAHVGVRAARRASSHRDARIRSLDCSAIELDGLSALKDCDLVFSCVDRPAARATLNALAASHLIPVVDGGVMVDIGRSRMRGAEWRSHVVAPGRRCMLCLGQFDPSLVQADRDGMLDDPSYLSRLPKGHPLRRSENVFAFSAATAAAQVLAALRMVVAPAGVDDAGAQLFHFATGTTDLDERGCDLGCPYSAMTGLGDLDGQPRGFIHKAADRERAARSVVQSQLRRRIAIRTVRVLEELGTRLDRIT